LFGCPSSEFKHAQSLKMPVLSWISYTILQNNVKQNTQVINTTFILDTQSHFT